MSQISVPGEAGKGNSNQLADDKNGMSHVAGGGYASRDDSDAG